MAAPVQVSMAEVWAYNASVHIPLARIHSHDHTELQWSVRNIVQLCGQEDESFGFEMTSSITYRYPPFLAFIQISPKTKQNHMYVLM